MTKRIRQGAAIAVAGLLATATACTGQQSSTPGFAGRHLSAGPGANGAGAGGEGGADSFTLLASGDVLPHSSIIDRAAVDAGGAGYDFRPMLKGAAPAVSGADLAICHMETVYGRNGGPYTGYPDFRSPPEVATALRATGYDSCSTASNHTLDDGTQGIRRTLDALDRAGIAHAGSARSAEESSRPTMLRAGKGKDAAKVAHLAYTYGTNDRTLPDGQPWAVNLIDKDRIVADARTAREAGADVVVVSLHWGTEWQERPDDDQLDLGHALTASTTGKRPDIDLIIGTHAHVPQAYEKVNGTWIVYGMGDQVAGAMVDDAGVRDPRANESSMGRFTFERPAEPGRRWEVRKAEFLPQLFDPEAARVVGLDREAGRLREIRERIQGVVLSRGAAQDGLVAGK
ncbi:CapA family protein [[Kitasatospora] papulosa]|uniref:CapA family protein n=1 Tax=[Kitasatospora] papulosa TaxID=1464011 RepID=A0ABZ1KB73_9ACTN|nr:MULTISPECIES: CapA family protein [Streptomyces]MCY1655112.1 CapA family protein [Streptomyces sp. SL203]MCY1677554.1 CapA family protein [Streptomyces sp. SL294]MDX2621071.1 CapA family protein [Streptomyces sp. WI03-5b]WSI15982.1 CapA family protein [[Kitasatospora] papulosa]WSZ51876.1 CapA family protein [[Kitasatospora] papulosa]